MTNYTLKIKLYWFIYFIIFWFGSYAYLYVYQMGGPKPLYAYFAVIFLTVIWEAYQNAIGNNRRQWDRLLTLTFIWIGSYVIYLFLDFLLATHNSVSIQTLISLTEGAILLACFIWLMISSSQFIRIEVLFVFLAVLGASICIFDFINPTFTKVPGRAAGLYINPTIAGSFIAMAMVAGLNKIPDRWKALYIIYCGMGILVTFARSSWLLWLVAVVMFYKYGKINFADLRTGIISLVILIGVIGGGLFVTGQSQIIEDIAVQQYLTTNTRHRLGISGNSLENSSTQQRMKVAEHALERFSKRPVVGYGLGYTGEYAGAWDFRVGTHNMYLKFLVEGGFLGLLVYCSLILLLIRVSKGVANILTIQFIIQGFFSHNLLKQPAYITILSFIIIYSIFLYKE